MQKNELAQQLLFLLTELEKAGEIVIVNPNVSVIAHQLSAGIIEKWADEFLEMPPSEIVIDECVGSSTRYICEEFSLPEKDAQLLVENFIEYLSKTRSLREVSDLVSHQGYHDIAFGAYYCFHLKLGEYYSRGYIDWRKDMYAKQRDKRVSPNKSSHSAN